MYVNILGIINVATHLQMNPAIYRLCSGCLCRNLRCLTRFHIESKSIVKVDYQLTCSLLVMQEHRHLSIFFGGEGGVGNFIYIPIFADESPKSKNLLL